MANLDVPYQRNIKRFEKQVCRTKFNVKYLPSWWPMVKDKPVIISEGDSWFDFPVKSITDVLGLFLRKLTGLQNFGMDSNTNVMDCVSRDKNLDGLFLRLERSGDHADELSAQQPDKRHGVWEKKVPSQTLYTALQNKTVQKHLDVIMLSAGGNDLVKAVRHGVLQEYNGDWQQSYDEDLLKAAGVFVVEHYLKAIHYRDEFAPKAQVLCHSYAYAIQLASGTKTEFKFSDIGWLIGALLKFMNLDMIQKPLKAIGIDVDDLGGHTIQSDSNLHETLDALGWPKNPDVNTLADGESQVHPERAQFIKRMLDSLYEQMMVLPVLYKAETGKDLAKFEYLDIRETVQDPKYWADFIHLNPLGYDKVSKIFVDKVKEMLD